MYFLTAQRFSITITNLKRQFCDSLRGEEGTREGGGEGSVMIKI